ncbi:unnamed protein product [Cladocopium goreaui]|uniref:Uncharacterized protein n=1 Tax=Cladocopium goreaui TaxID=2562237 RepID=A0A9P1CQZ4_9DINO|nr:unnamed protein product [Cladocopium goreaui]
MASTVEVENQGTWPPWIPPTLSSNLPVGLQGVLSPQDYQAIKSNFDQMLAPTAVNKRTMVAFLVVPLIVLSIILVTTLVQFYQGEQQMTVYIGGGFGTFFLVTSVFSALQRHIREMKRRRDNAYNSFVTQMNQNFPQTQWEIQEFESRGLIGLISFTVVPTGATLPAAIVSDGVAPGATVPVVAAVVVGSAETNEGNPIQVTPMVVSGGVKNFCSGCGAPRGSGPFCSQCGQRLETA